MSWSIGGAAGSFLALLGLTMRAEGTRTTEEARKTASDLLWPAAIRGWDSMRHVTAPVADEHGEQRREYTNFGVDSRHAGGH
jgi:hypothetical protein